MKRPIILIILNLLFSGLFAQENIIGVYSENSIANQQLSLFSDSTYQYKRESNFCVGPRELIDYGNYSIAQDTITLFPVDSNEDVSKYLIITTKNAEKLNVSPFWTIGSIGFIWTSDTILESKISGRLNDFKVLTYPSLTKTKEFFENGNIKFDIQNKGKETIGTYYYPTGQLKKVERLHKGLKHGDWMYFNPNGEIEKIETYRRNKLKKTACNTSYI